MRMSRRMGIYSQRGVRENTLTPNRIVDIRRYYRRVVVRHIDVVTQTNEIISDTTDYLRATENFSAETYARAGSTNFSNTTTTQGATQQTTTTTCWQNRLMVSFSLPSLSDIATATLRLYPVLSDYSGNMTNFTVRRITSTWQADGATWNTMYSKTTATGAISTLQLPVQQWTELDVTDLIKADTNGYGLMIYVDTLSNFGRVFSKSGQYVPQLHILME